MAGGRDSSERRAAARWRRESYAFLLTWLQGSSGSIGGIRHKMDVSRITYRSKNGARSVPRQPLVRLRLARPTSDELHGISGQCRARYLSCNALRRQRWARPVALGYSRPHTIRWQGQPMKALEENQDRHACPNCRQPMRLTHVVPRQGGLPELTGFRCFLCGEVSTKAGAFDV
jgi:hypothetical protein